MTLWLGRSKDLNPILLLEALVETKFDCFWILSMFIRFVDWKKSCFGIRVTQFFFLFDTICVGLLFNQLIKLSKCMIICILIDNFGKCGLFIFLQEGELLYGAFTAALEVGLGYSHFAKFVHG